MSARWPKGNRVGKCDYCKVKRAKRCWALHIEAVGIIDVWLLFCNKKCLETFLDIYKNSKDSGCICQGCGKKYQVDLILPDELWKLITPKPESNEGLLCLVCIGSRLEKLNKYMALKCIYL